MTDLPAGFVLDGATAAAAPTAMPQGFVLDTPPKARQRGSILPLSFDEGGGNVAFDSDAGLLGAVKRAVMLPGEVIAGKVDPLSPEGGARAREMATVISPTPAAMRAGELAIPGALRVGSVRRAEPKAPTAEALREASTAGYDRTRDMGVEYSSAAVKSMGEGIQRNLEADGILAELSPKTFAILKKLQSPPDGSVASLSGLDAARKSLGHAAGDFTNKTEQLAARRAIEELDGFLGAADPSSVVARAAAPTGTTGVTKAGHDFGPTDAAAAQANAEAAARALEHARGNFAAAARSDRLTGKQEAAELVAASSNSGANVDNAIRQRLRSILTSPKEGRGYSDEELALIEGAVRGTRSHNAARYTGNLLGGGGGLGAGFTAAASGTGAAALSGDPLMAAFGLVPPAIGAGSKALANALTRKQVGKIDEAVRKRSPLYEQLLRDAPTTVVTPDNRAALARALMLYSASDNR